MSIQSLPAASLRTGNRLPAARVLLRVVNYLICMFLSRVGSAISGRESSFLPALRETPGGGRRSTRRACGPGRRILCSADPEQLCRGAAEDGDAVVVAQPRDRHDVVDR